MGQALGAGSIGGKGAAGDGHRTGRLHAHAGVELVETGNAEVLDPAELDAAQGVGPEDAIQDLEGDVRHKPHLGGSGLPDCGQRPSGHDQLAALAAETQRVARTELHVIPEPVRGTQETDVALDAQPRVLVQVEGIIVDAQPIDLDVHDGARGDDQFPVQHHLGGGVLGGHQRGGAGHQHQTTGASQGTSPPIERAGDPDVAAEHVRARIDADRIRDQPLRGDGDGA